MSSSAGESFHSQVMDALRKHLHEGLERAGHAAPGWLGPAVRMFYPRLAGVIQGMSEADLRAELERIHRTTGELLDSGRDATANAKTGSPPNKTAAKKRRNPAQKRVQGRAAAKKRNGR